MSNKIYSVVEIKRLISPILQQNNIVKAVLFGSYAKGTATNKSDVDIFIDSNGKLVGLNFFEVYNEIESTLNKKIDLIEAVDVEKNSKIYSEINEYGVSLYE